MLVAKLLQLRALDLCSRVLVPTSSVVSLVLVCFQSTTKSNCSCSARPSREDLVKCTTKLLEFRHRWVRLLQVKVCGTWEQIGDVRAVRR